MNTLSAILSSNTRAEFFRLLFNGDGREYHMRDLSRLSSSSIGTIQQESAKLTNLGLITKRRNGNRVYLKANTSHQLFNPISELVKKTSGLADVFHNALMSVNEIEQAFIFGSIADGTATERSDIDVMVIGEISLRELSKVLKKPSLQLQREINPHVFTKEEFIKRIHRKEHFVCSVIKSKRIFIKGTEYEFARMAE